MRILIADDEAPARARLRELLAHENDIEIVGEYANGDDAIDGALTERPDLIFLDIEMPRTNGLDVLQEISRVMHPRVIFTTAHAESAVEAFNLEATDYLLKPFSRARFASALQRARRHVADAGVESDANSATTDRLLIKTGKGYRVVPAEDIISIQAAANYVVLRTADSKHIMRRTLSQLVAELCPRRFFRTSRSTVANLHHVREVSSTASGHQIVVLSDGNELPLTVGLRELQARLRNLA
ncbi:LytR/AlgR family response regulator transcription factor [Synoicihabitans lomoniglobus]|uniref:LytTR family DNA-binding domain-containing protein n=1 Tax=Synoicihabitans lomoniglobus TaxID=2909285 RepID=A0AAF0CH29_9BACT|nr:LytTR family DNA-binding domain-containing protein [Opitutaceae bacterium LMO-M01]WED63842.1 LytTR family DNA-binding domain-containing protein [Opitutaceae bacterium LMO-M01]